MRLYLHQNCNTHVLICRRYVKQCNCMYSLIMITTNLSILLSRIFLKGKTLYPLLFNQFSFKLKIVLATVLHFSIKFNFYADDTPLALCCSQYYWSLTSVQVVLSRSCLTNTCLPTYSREKNGSLWMHNMSFLPLGVSCSIQKTSVAWDHGSCCLYC